METLDPILFMIIGGCLAGPLGWLLARDQIRKRLDDLRDETESRARKRAQRQVREELADTIRRELIDEVTAEVRQDAEDDAERILEEARDEADKQVRNARLEAREIISDARREVDEELEERRQKLDQIEERLGNREQALDERAQRLDDRETQVQGRASRLEERSDELEQQLADIGDYSRDEARRQLEQRLVEQAEHRVARRLRDIESDARESAEKTARKIIAAACQRYAGDYVTENCSDVVKLPGDDMKGRIIGREGRNIRALEGETGADIIVDDTPEVVTVSCFDPVRREIARRSLEKLVADGRIHPARIEQVVHSTDQEIARAIERAGEEATLELGIHGMDDELLEHVGRLKFRTSYGQNMWAHSIEVGFLCGLMASELGVDVDAARRAGLLHDVGKAISHKRDESHALVGAELADRCGEEEVVRNAIAAHHNEEPQNSVIAHLVIAADSLSGARPGARREVLGTYVKRLEELEGICAEFDGVKKAYAIQAGREVRVMVERDVDDDTAASLSREIAGRIEEQVTYPGQVKVTVIRETRAVEYAR